MGALAIATDPAAYGWPPGLPIELALAKKQGVKPKDVCASYGLARSDYQRLCQNPGFLKALDAAFAEIEKEGVTFRRKAQVQAEELLKTSWSLIHDQSGDVPATVKGDLIKWTMRVAGYDASLDQKAAQANAQAVNALQIVINLGDT